MNYLFTLLPAANISTEGLKPRVAGLNGILDFAGHCNLCMCITNRKNSKNYDFNTKYLTYHRCTYSCNLVLMYRPVVPFWRKPILSFRKLNEIFHEDEAGNELGYEVEVGNPLLSFRRHFPQSI